jgi:hypothetical protein
MWSPAEISGVNMESTRISEVHVESMWSSSEYLEFMWSPSEISGVHVESCGLHQGTNEE